MDAFDISIVERLGTLGVLLVGVAYACRWIATKVVEPLVAAVVSLIEQLRISEARQTDTLGLQAETLKQQATTLDRMAETQERMAETQQEICEILKSSSKEK